MHTGQPRSVWIKTMSRCTGSNGTQISTKFFEKFSIPGTSFTRRQFDRPQFDRRQYLHIIIKLLYFYIDYNFLFHEGY